MSDLPAGMVCMYCDKLEAVQGQVAGSVALFFMHGCWGCSKQPGPQRTKIITPDKRIVTIQEAQKRGMLGN